MFDCFLLLTKFFMYFSPLHNIFHVAQYFTSAIVSLYSINLQLQHGIGCIMRRIHAKFCLSWTQLMQHVQHWKLCVRSLTYNSYGSAIDAAFEPVFSIVDFAVRWFGVAFVTLVVCLTSSVVIIFYLNVLPFVMETHSSFFAHIHLAYGHYLLLMILFHYYKAVTTDPGTPPTEATNVPVTSICKKCIAPKPPRAHHCSVCRKCRLKMDHHCPWLNNCVGHFNHRYFISFCIFMLLGTSYVSLSSWSIFSDCFGLPEKWLDIRHSLYRMTGRSADDMSDEIRAVKIRHDFGANICKGRGRFFHSGTVYLWLLCSAVTVALGCLTMWHIYLISRAETSIDRLMNQKERQRMKKLKLSFSNPYSFGLVENWKRLLGFESIRSFITRVLLPSAHLPDEDGVRWKVTRFQRAVVT